jgi:Ca-activated chloride channel family protein
MLTEEEFNDAQTDAGEIGEGHTVIAVYEVTLKNEVANDFFFKAKLRYKDVKTNSDVEIVDQVKTINVMSDDFKFVSAVCEFGLLLRDSSFKGQASYEHLIEFLETLDLSDDYHKQEFLELVKISQRNTMLNQ